MGVVIVGFSTLSFIMLSYSIALFFAINNLERQGKPTDSCRVLPKLALGTPPASPRWLSSLRATRSWQSDGHIWLAASQARSL